MKWNDILKLNSADQMTSTQKKRRSIGYQAWKSVSTFFPIETIGVTTNGIHEHFIKQYNSKVINSFFASHRSEAIRYLEFKKQKISDIYH